MEHWLIANKTLHIRIILLLTANCKKSGIILASSPTIRVGIIEVNSIYYRKDRCIAKY
jgi:hypothetical protein